jgi:hypothetical protein
MRRQHMRQGSNACPEEHPSGVAAMESNDRKIVEHRKFREPRRRDEFAPPHMNDDVTVIVDRRSEIERRAQLLYSSIKHEPFSD